MEPMTPEDISQQTIPQQLQKQIYEQYLQAVDLNEMLFSSLPHPAMLIRGRDKVIVAANKIALEMGAKVGGHCWREFRKTQFISQKDKDVIAKYRDIVPAQLGIGCTFCLGDECLSESPKQKTTVDAFGKTWDIFWIRVNDDIYLHHCIDITEHKQMENALSKSHECLSTVLDSLDSAVYVADFKSYEILFVNKYIRDIFGDIEGRTCWQTIQIGQKGPCPFCTNDRLVSDTGISTGLYQWEFQNTVTGRWYVSFRQTCVTLARTRH